MASCGPAAVDAEHRALLVEQAARHLEQACGYAFVGAQPPLQSPPPLPHRHARLRARAPAPCGGLNACPCCTEKRFEPAGYEHLVFGQLDPIAAAQRPAELPHGPALFLAVTERAPAAALCPGDAVPRPDTRRARL